MASAPPSEAPQVSKKHGTNPTVVLVHGAFADSGGGKGDVTGRLMNAGYPRDRLLEPAARPDQRR